MSLPHIELVYCVQVQRNWTQLTKKKIPFNRTQRSGDNETCYRIIQFRAFRAKHCIIGDEHWKGRPMYNLTLSSQNQVSNSNERTPMFNWSMMLNSWFAMPRQGFTYGGGHSHVSFAKKKTKKKKNAHIASVFYEYFTTRRNGFGWFSSFLYCLRP